MKYKVKKLERKKILVKRQLYRKERKKSKALPLWTFFCKFAFVF